MAYTFGQVKDQLATVTDNGVPPTDPRVMTRTNEAIKMLMDEGIWVGSMMTVTLSPATRTFSIPATMENVIEARQTVGGGTDFPRGHYNIFNSNVYLDPELHHDNPLIDRGESGGVRSYEWPELILPATVRLTGLKKWVPIDSDDDELLIQNIRAIKLAILSIEKGENRDGDDAQKYLDRAKALLAAEVKRYMLDPRNAIERKSDYRQDLALYPGFSQFGHIRAKLALELPGGLQVGRSDIGYSLNQAHSSAVDHYNFVVRRESFGAVPLDKFSLVPAAATELPYSNYEVLKLLAQASMKDVPLEQATALRQQALDLIERNVAEETETANKEKWLAEVNSYAEDTVGFARARLGLDLPDGLRLAPTELLRLVNSAEHRLMSAGKWKGTLAEYSAEVVGGVVLFPRDVESILAASLCGRPITIRGRYYEYHENTPGFHDSEEESCASLLIDQGESTEAGDGTIRRKYKVMARLTESNTLRVLAKRRWLSKSPDDKLVIKNYEALRLMVLSIVAQGDPKTSETYRSQALATLEKELQEYLAGIRPHVEIQTRGTGRRIPRLR